MLAEVIKLLGNSSYGKVIDALARHTTVKYTTSESASVWFQDLEEIGEPIEYHLPSGGSSVSASKAAKQLFANEATFEPIVQILQNRFTGFDDVFSMC